jgi:hypothetical protein
MSKEINYNKDNLSVWDAHSAIPDKFLKKISGKDYRGNSPNATYIVKCLTSLFGKCGEGWGYTVKDQGFYSFENRVVLHWVIIKFWTGSRDNYFEQFGQTKAAYPTQQSTYKVDEDAPKKSITDAITKAASHLGIASDIYLGLYDDNKYIKPIEEDETINPAQVKASNELSHEELEFIKHTIAALETLETIDMLDAQMKNISFCCKDRGYDRRVIAQIYEAYIKICKNNQWTAKIK